MFQDELVYVTKQRKQRQEGLAYDVIAVAGGDSAKSKGWVRTGLDSQHPQEAHKSPSTLALEDLVCCSNPLRHQHTHAAQTQIPAKHLYT